MSRDSAIAGLLFGSGVMKAWNAWESASQQQEEEKKKRQAYQNQIGELNKFKGDLIGEQRSSGTDMMTNYITTRDNQKASGIANMYLQKYSDFKNSLRNTDAEIRQNQTAMSEVPTTTNADKWSGLLGAAVETGAGIYGQYASAMEGMNNKNTLTTLNNSLLGKETTPGMLQKEQGFGEWFSNNTIGKDATAKIGSWMDNAVKYVKDKNDFLNKSPIGYRPDFNLNSNKFDFGNRKPFTFNGGF